MRRCGKLVWFVVLLSLVRSLRAADPSPQASPTRPYLVLFASSIDKVVNSFEVVFDSVDRHDLSISLGDRFKSYRNFAGIDRGRPLGIMTTWDDVTPVEIVFVPVGDINELLKTVTFEIVGYHEVSPNRFEIERPGTPYHVIVRQDYAFSAESPRSIQALNVTPDQLTRRLRDQYELVALFDLKQIPRKAKATFIESLRQQIEPWLQRQDDEAAESANLRRTLGKLTLDLIERVVMDTETVTIGLHLDPETKQIVFDVIVEAEPKSMLASQLSQLASFRSEFSSLLSPDVAAGIALNLPLGGLVEKMLASTEVTPAKGPRSKSTPHLETGLQLVGSGLGDFSLIAALRGSDAAELNQAIPKLILKLEKSGGFTQVNENFDVHRDVILHSLVPRELPRIITQLVGSNVEIIVGQGEQTIWIGIGQPKKLVKQIQEAIDLVSNSTVNRKSAPLVRGRFSAKQLPELPLSDVLGSNIDKDVSRAEFAQGDDGFGVTLEPVSNGLRLRIEAEEGFVRLIGRDWIKQIEGTKP